MKLRDKMWLWGHPEGRYNHEYGNEKESRMTPMEGCLYLGVRNTFMVPVGVDVNRRQYNKSFTTLRNVGWECFGMHKKPEILDTAIANGAYGGKINGSGGGGCCYVYAPREAAEKIIEEVEKLGYPGKILTQDTGVRVD